MRYLQFKDNKTTDFDLLIQPGHIDRSAQRDRTFVSVSGRSGDLIQDNGRFLNYEDSYTLGLLPGSDRETQARNIRNWLQSSTGYEKLIDSKYPTYFRKAIYTSTVDIETIIRDLGQLTATFNCKPFRFRFDGDDIQTFTSAGTLTNPELWPSLPYLKVYGSGDITLHINDQDIVLTGVSDYIEIDSELKSCFKDLVLQNSHYRSEFWPVLNPGPINISWTGTVTKVELKPRWMTL